MDLQFDVSEQTNHRVQQEHVGWALVWKSVSFLKAEMAKLTLEEQGGEKKRFQMGIAKSISLRYIGELQTV